MSGSNLVSQKRRAVWRLAGDIRGDGAAILLNLWQGLGSSELGTGPEPPIRYGVTQLPCVIEMTILTSFMTGLSSLPAFIGGPCSKPLSESP